MNPKTKIAPNFTLGEALHWCDNIPMSEKERAYCKRLTENNYREHLTNIKIGATGLQMIRNLVNSLLVKQFISEGYGIDLKGVTFGIVVTSWYRPEQWEKYRGRSGMSKHITGHAIDFKVVALSGKVNGKIMDRVNDFVFEWLKETHEGGVAIAYRQDGSISFIHMDWRGVRARWTY